MRGARVSSKQATGGRSVREYLREIGRHRHYYVLLLPAIAMFVVFRYIPMAGIVVAFKRYNLDGGLFGGEWVGTLYFQRLFGNAKFFEVLWNTLRISVLKLVIGFPAPVVFALMLGEIRGKGARKTFQTISYLPHFVSWVVVGGLARELLSTRGVINVARGWLGLAPVLFLQQPDSFDAILIVSMIWQNVGWGAIIYLAAMAGVDTTLYEAATIDGAGRLHRIWHVTFPSIAPVILVMFLLRVGNILEAGFDQVFNLYNPLVYGVADIIDTYVYRFGIAGFQYSITAAASLFQNTVGLLLLFVVNGVTRRLQPDSAIV